jgi:predicted phosphodiesterase
MKVAVLSDIHGNLPALQAVAADIDSWCPDLTIVNGDIVNRGPSSVECWSFVREQPGWLIASGNHEKYVLLWHDPAWNAAAEGPDALYAPSGWTYEQLGEQVGELAGLPEVVALADPGGGELRAVHGSMRGDRDGIYPDTPELLLAQQINPAPRLFCTAHTHRPFVRRLNGTLVVNSGAAGWTFDGDLRASYARLTWQRGAWQAEIMRVAYDRRQAARDFVKDGYYESAGPLARIMYVEWHEAMPLFHHWVTDYEPGVITGELTVAEAAAAMLGHLGLDAIQPPGSDG